MKMWPPQTAAARNAPAENMLQPKCTTAQDNNITLDSRL